MSMHFINYEWNENSTKYEVSEITNTASVSWYILWKCTKYNEHGNAYVLYLLLSCHKEGISNHLSLAIITSNNPFWQRKCKCLGVSRVNISVAMETSSSHFVVVLLNTWHCEVKISVSIMFMPDCTLCIYPPYLKSLHAKQNKSFGGLAFFYDYLPLTDMALSYTQIGKKNNLWEIFFRQFQSTGRRAVNWHIFLCKNSFGFLKLPSLTYMHIFIDSCFLLFLFFAQMSLLYLS